MSDQPGDIVLRDGAKFLVLADGRLAPWTDATRQAISEARETIIQRAAALLAQRTDAAVSALKLEPVHASFAALREQFAAQLREELGVRPHAPKSSTVAGDGTPWGRGPGARTDYDALRMCTYPDCSARPHIENCPECMGWGFYADTGPVAGRPGGIISAREARTDRPFLECSVCGGRPLPS